MLASVEMMGVVVKSNPHHSELVEESRRTAAGQGGSYHPHHSELAD